MPDEHRSFRELFVCYIINSMKKILSIILALVLLTVGYYFFSHYPERNIEEITNSFAYNLKINEKELKVEIARTDVERNRGLSWRETLENDTGLLFIFDSPGEYGFWMKDMNFPIDIIWITSERRVSSCDESIRPESFPATFFPKEPVQFVLEVRAGSCSLWGVSPGDMVSWEQ